MAHFRKSVMKKSCWLLFFFLIALMLNINILCKFAECILTSVRNQYMN